MDNSLIKEIESLPGFYLNKFDRTQLRQEVEEYWVGKDTSIFGVGAFTIDWNTRIMTRYLIYRRDIFQICFTINNEFRAIFIEPDLNWNRYELNGHEELVRKLDEYIHKHLPVQEKEFFDRQLKWYNEGIIDLLDGKTPEQAVVILKERGW